MGAEVGLWWGGRYCQRDTTLGDEFICELSCSSPVSPCWQCYSVLCEVSDNMASSVLPSAH